MAHFFRKFGMLGVALGVASVVAAQTSMLRFDDDRTALVNGERTFILGLYENPEDDAALKEVAEAGFNLVQAKDREALDRLQAHGLRAWVNTGGLIAVNPDDRNAPVALLKLLDDLKDHPALLVWEAPDEALWNVWHSAQAWRHWEEPKVLREKILATQKDPTALLEDLGRVQTLNAEGYYAEAEALADALWKELGETSPKPGLNLADAQERSDTLIARMMIGHQFIRRYDPAHPVWMNHAPRNDLEQLASFSMAADIVGCDIYPVPPHPKLQHSDLTDRALTSVGAYTRRMLSVATPRKPVWMVLQGFGWKDLGEEFDQELRRPNRNELRFMAWDAVVNGATGILFWGTAYIEKDSQLWGDLLAVVRELADSQDILTAPAVDPGRITYAPSYGSRESGVLALLKPMDGKNVILAVNQEATPLTFTLHYLEKLEGVTYRARHYEKAQATVQDGKLTLTIPPYAAYVLEPQE